MLHAEFSLAESPLIADYGRCRRTEIDPQRSFVLVLRSSAMNLKADFRSTASYSKSSMSLMTVAGDTGFVKWLLNPASFERARVFIGSPTGNRHDLYSCQFLNCP